MEQRKRSTAVVLTLVGLAGGVYALSNVAQPQPEMRRNLYTNRAACEQDYSPAQCQPNSTSSSTSSSTGHSYYVGSYHGPYYYANRQLASARSDPGPGRTGHITRTEVSRRGGFGSFGRGLHRLG